MFQKIGENQNNNLWLTEHKGYVEFDVYVEDTQPKRNVNKKSKKLMI